MHNHIGLLNFFAIVLVSILFSVEVGIVFFSFQLVAHFLFDFVHCFIFTQPVSLEVFKRLQTTWSKTNSRIILLEMFSACIIFCCVAMINNFRVNFADEDYGDKNKHRVCLMKWTFFVKMLAGWTFSIFFLISK